MPVPTTIADLNVTASLNSPAGSEAIGTSLDDYIRAHGAIIKQHEADLAATTSGKGAAMLGRGAPVVSSITALRALLKTSAAQHAFVTGYYAQGDGGGGAYWYDSSDTTSADNGGTIIVATDGGRWKLAQTGITSIQQWGIKGDGATDDTARLQVIVTRGGHYWMPYGTVTRTTAPITGSLPLIFEGPGCIAFTDLGEAANVRGDGAWFHFDHTGKGFVLDGTSGTSDGIAVIRFKGCGSFRTQPTPGGGAFTPTAHDWDFDVTDVEIEFDDFVPLNPTKYFRGVLARGGKATFTKVRGQPLLAGIDLDQAFDLCSLDVHFWPYWSLNTNVIDYTRANLISVEVGRVDGLRLPRLFSYGHFVGLKVTDKGFGVVGVRSGYANFDNGAYGIKVEAAATAASIFLEQLLVFGLSASTSYGIHCAGTNTSIKIGISDLNTFFNQAIFLGGTGNRVQISQPAFYNYSFTGVGPGVDIAVGNEVVFDGKVVDVPLGGRFLLANAGTLRGVDQWITYNTTVTAGSGTITTVGATVTKYRLNGDMVDVSYLIPITTNGTGASSLDFTLPYTIADYSCGAAREISVTGTLCSVQMTPGQTKAIIRTYNNAYPAGDGHAIVGMLSYRRQ